MSKNSFATREELEVYRTETREMIIARRGMIYAPYEHILEIRDYEDIERTITLGAHTCWFILMRDDLHVPEEDICRYSDEIYKREVPIGHQLY